MSNPALSLTDPICIIPGTSLDYAKSHVRRLVRRVTEASKTQVTPRRLISTESLKERASMAGLPASVQPGRWTPSFVLALPFDPALPVTVKPTNNTSTITSSSTSCSSCLPHSSCCRRGECQTMPDSCKGNSDALKFGALRRRSVGGKKINKYEGLHVKRHF